MVTTISAGFNKLRENLEITGLQSETAAARQKTIREVVQDGLTVKDSFLGGSYARSTMIGPLKESDIDIFVVLDVAYFKEYKPAALLDKLRAVLLKQYPTTPKISRNGQAVTITFTDFTVDVVPCFYRQGGGFLIPNSITAKWIETDPTAYAAQLSAANKLHNGDLIPLIKMIRGWNRTISNAFSGFYLELMISDILNNIKISDYPSGARFVFDKGREKIKYMQRNPAGYGDEVQGLRGVSNVADATSRFETAYSRALKAEEFASKGHAEHAIGEWRKIFGTYFPAYG